MLLGWLAGLLLAIGLPALGFFNGITSLGATGLCLPCWVLWPRWLVHWKI